MESKILLVMILGFLLLFLTCCGYVALKKEICRIENGKLRCDYRPMPIGLVRAIRCSHYRCLKGCESEETEYYCSECEAYDENGDGFVCNRESILHPVQVKLNKEFPITVGSIPNVCMFKTDQYEFKIIGSWSAFHPNDIVEVLEEKDNCIKKLIVKRGGYYIWSLKPEYGSENVADFVWREHLCFDCSRFSEDKDFCESCGELGLNEECYYDEYYGECTDQIPECSPDYPSIIETDCKSFCEYKCDSKLSKCFCNEKETPNICDVECDCDKITTCEDYTDKISCESNDCLLEECEWSPMLMKGECHEKR